MKIRTVSVIGAGSWGTALGVHLAGLGHDVRLWARDPDLVTEMKSRRANAVYLPDVNFPETLQPVARMAEALDGALFVVVAVPSHGMRDVLRLAAPHTASGAIVVSATKGLEEGSLLRMTEIVTQELPGIGAVVALSGPSFAMELARELPTAVVAASTTPDAFTHVQEEFRSNALRLYGTSDVVGVEIGGALKNIIAISAGVVEGLGLGHNALAALITRGLAEIGRLAVALGAQRETLAGLAGLGDLGTDLHRTTQSQSARWSGARARAFAPGDSCEHEDGGRGRSHDTRRLGARRALRSGTADCGADGGSARRPAGSAGRGL